MGVTLNMVRVSVLLVLTLLCIAASAKRPNGNEEESTGGNKPSGNKPSGNKPSGNKPNKPGNGGGNKPNKPGNGGGNKPNKPNKPGNGGGNKPGRPVKCDVATNFPCLLTGDQCVEGDKGPSCQKGDMTTMPVMPSCNTACGDSCACLLGRCVCGGDVIDDMDLSMEDMWKIVNCAAESVGQVKKGCKKDCLTSNATLQGCSECVLMKTKCLQASAGMI